MRQVKIIEVLFLKSNITNYNKNYYYSRLLRPIIEIKPCVYLTSSCPVAENSTDFQNDFCILRKRNVRFLFGSAKYVPQNFDASVSQ